MDMVRNVFFCLLMLLCIIVHLSVTEEYQTCNVHERLNTGLAKILDPARVIAVSYDTHSSFDCYRLCCNSTVGGQCNAVTFYRIESDDLCMMLDCTPFGNCVWMTADGFYAAHVTLSTVSSQINSSPDTSETEVTMSPLTEELTTISSTPSPQVPVEAVAAVETVSIPGTESQPYSSSIVEELPQNDDEWKWNTEGSVDNTNNGQTDRNTQTEPTTTLKQDFPEQQGFPTQGVDPEESEWSQGFNEGVDPADSSFGDPEPSNPEGLPEGDSATGNSQTTSEEDSSTSDIKHREMRRMLFQTPAVIIGLCSALGVSFLVLVAVCRKVYINQDRPRYKQLRDYDIRFEPPAASSALLP